MTDVFAAYKKPNLSHEFEKLPDVSIEFRFPTSEDELMLQQYMASGATLLETQVYQLALLVEGTNLLTEDGEPILRPEFSELEKMQIFFEMPVGMLTELSEALVAYYPDWELME